MGYRSSASKKPNVGTAKCVDLLSPKKMSSKHFGAAFYARVSTADQQTTPLQIGAMQDYARRRGWTIVAEVRDVNGGAKLRPKREELLKLARQRKLDVIIVWRLDRWGRSLHDVLQSLEELRELDVDFVSVTQMRTSPYRANIVDTKEDR
jgi:DNA invertase Pin-like site-specific DNA recombinase